MNRGGGGRLRDSNRRDMATSSSGVHSAVIGWREDRRPHHRHLTRAHVRPELSGSRSLLCLLGERGGLKRGDAMFAREETHRIANFYGFCFDGGRGGSHMSADPDYSHLARMPLSFMGTAKKFRRFTQMI
ncbi:hypothetical protein Q1695_000777 [Nippostrongylus brasiliensis]|nr:hypothetical protein Q1695_000777 [Nippostrongylus brasiliensis]